MAQQVTMEIVDLFLEENKSDRKRRSEISYTFLLNELRRLEDEAVKVDLKLADYKKQNIGKLPEQAELTLKVADRLERDIAEADRQLFDLRQQNMALLIIYSYIILITFVKDNKDNARMSSL